MTMMYLRTLWNDIVWSQILFLRIIIISLRVWSIMYFIHPNILPVSYFNVLFCVCFKFLFVSLLLTCMLSVFFRLFLSSIALPNTRRSVSRPEQVRQVGPVRDQEQDVGVTVLIASRLNQGLHQTRAVPFSAREYHGFGRIL